MEIRKEMEDFMIHVPTQIFFGRSAIDHLAESIAKWSPNKRVLLVYGGGSIKRTGLYDTVLASLKEAGLSWAELGGVQPNPLLALAKEGIARFRAEQCDVLLAVGGGSAIDTAKVIGLGVPYDGDVWDFWCGKATPKAGIPTTVILTIAAAGSETSQSAVITNEDGMLKRGLNSELNRPLFSIMNPELTYTLPAYQTAALLKTLGIASHTYVLPHNVAKFLMKNVYRNGTLHCEEVVDTLLNGLFSLYELRTVDIGLRLCELLGEVISDSDRKDEVTIGQSLHKGRSAKTVSTVVREVSLTDSVKTRDSSFEIVVYPDTTHSVVDSRVNHHRLFPR